MLKIKDNVDLKQLEKFGFKVRYECDHRTGKSEIDYMYSSRADYTYGSLNLIPVKIRKFLYIMGHKRHIENNLNYTPLKFQYGSYIDLELLYDLIQAGLVEKER